MTRTFPRHAPLALATWLALSACAIDRIPFAAACVQGRAEVCTCGDGSQGAAECAPDGVFGACQCTAPSTGALNPPMLAPSGGAAGSAGSGGQDVADDGAAGGVGGAPVVDSGALDAPDARVTTGDDAGIDASTGGSGGSTHDPDPVAEPSPGEAYGACRGDGSCDQPLFCTLDVSGTPYCAAFCSTSFGTSCPPHPSGEPAPCITGVCMR